jgi:hypothetical protein
MATTETQIGSRILRATLTCATHLKSMLSSRHAVANVGGTRQRAQRRMSSRLAAAAIAAGTTLGFATTAHATVHSNDTPVWPGQTATLNITCPSGNVVSGGAVTTTPRLRVFRSFPLTDNVTWSVSATNLDSTVQTLYISAICRTGLASYDMRAAAVSTGGNAVGEAVASCLSGRQAMGGGFWTANANVPIIGSRIQGNNWRVRGYNLNGSSSNITSFVTCSGSLPTRVDPPLVNTNVGPGGVSFPTWACPSSSQWLASGGFWSNVDHIWTIVTGSLPNASSGGNAIWKWNFRNWDSVSHSYERTISCF